MHNNQYTFTKHQPKAKIIVENAFIQMIAAMSMEELHEHSLLIEHEIVKYIDSAKFCNDIPVWAEKIKLIAEAIKERRQMKMFEISTP